MGIAFIKLHVSIFLAGFTGILGKLIQLAEGPLVWYRMLFAWVLFGAYLVVSRRFAAIPLIEALKIAGVGALVALHWLFFYGSLKYANVSIAVVCFAMTGFFTALLEPLFCNKKLSRPELVFSVIVVLGIGLIFHFDTRFRIGIVLGIIGALFAALFTIALKIVGKKHSASNMLFYQMFGGWAFVTAIAPLYVLFLPSTHFLPTALDVVYLFVLASLCTVLMFFMQIQVLRSMSAFTVNLSFNLEPVYSIALAMLLFGEGREVNGAFFVGLGLICLSVLLQSLYAIYRRS